MTPALGQNGSFAATVAQLAERAFRKRQVKGSNPFGGSLGSIVEQCCFYFFTSPVQTGCLPV